MRTSGKLVILALISCPGLAWGVQENFGSGGSSTWTMAAGTRALALGSTAGLLAKDATLLSHNPAAMVFLGHGEIGFHHGLWAAGETWDQAATVLPLGPNQAIGVAGALTSYGSFDRIDEFGRVNGSFQASEALTAAGYAQKFGQVGLGGSAFMTRQTIDKDVLYSYAWSLGTHWQATPALSLGSAVRSASEGSDPGAWVADFGIAMNSDPDPLRAWGLGLNSRYAGESRSQFQVGLTRGFSAGTFGGQVLGGYRLDFPTTAQLNALSAWTFGGSLTWQAWALDYAFQPMAELEASHHLGLRYSFGLPAPRGSVPTASITASPPPSVPLTAPSASVPSPLAASPAQATESTPSMDLPLPSTVVIVLSDGAAKGQSLEAQGKNAAALDAYAAAVASDPRDLPAWRAMARLYDRLEKPDQSLSAWREVVSLAPQDAEARAKLAGPLSPPSVKP